MRILLDTHAFLWLIEGQSQFSTPARQVIEDVTNDYLFSIASIWEIAIKISIGKLALRDPLASIFPQQMVDNGIALLDVTIAHIMLLPSLPFHHRDPFDRLVIAQAIAESLPILSADSVFDIYGINRIW